MTHAEKRPTKTTPLTEAHRAAGARLVDFAGFLMPLQYSGIIDEHQTVRQDAGLFDVSHMGEVFFRGADALEAIDRMVTNDVMSLRDGQVLYTPICYPDGGVVDDCLVYRKAADEALVVVNAANVKKDVDWFFENKRGNCTISDESEALALIALQGPRSAAIWRAVAGAQASDLAPFSFIEAEARGATCLISRTGYTGEDGFEIYCAAGDALDLWRAIMDAGEPLGLKPAGLGARDTLRLEAKLPLYGNDIDASTSPLEAGLGWTVKLKSGDFIGKQALIAQRQRGLERKLVCLVMRSRGIARHGHPIHAAEDQALSEVIGQVTSGTKSPTLGEAIALGYVPKALSKPGSRVTIDVRNKPVVAEVIKGPFYKRPH